MKKAMILALVLMTCLLVFAACKGNANPTEPSLPQPSSYTVVFHYENGQEPQTVRVDAGKRVREPMVDFRVGYEFAGWYLEDAAYNFATAVASDMTLRAKWKADVEWFVCDGVEYQCEGGLPESVLLGETVRFVLKLKSATAIPKVLVGKTEVLPDENGQYSFVVTEPTQIRVSDITYHPGGDNIDLPPVPLD